MLDRHNNALRSFNSVVKPTRQQTVLVLYLDFNEDVRGGGWRQISGSRGNAPLCGPLVMQEWS
jgi:hypothetical protein